jgi:uncharacterized protein YjiS (DUF1127 family)
MDTFRNDAERCAAELPASEFYDWFSGVNEGVTMFPISFSQFFRQWRAYDANLCRLSRLDDRALAMIGIKRLEIARVAWEKAERAA